MGVPSYGESDRSRVARVIRPEPGTHHNRASVTSAGEPGEKGVQVIEQFFREPSAAAQHRSAPVVGPYLDGIVGQLAEAGYRCKTVHRYIYACEDFGRFLADRR